MAGAVWLGRVTKGGCALFVLAVLALHVAQPELSPLTEAVSYYVHGRHGALLTGGLVALGTASLALATLLAGERSGRAVSIGVALWGVCLLLGAVFPADPRGSWSGPPSGAGLVHASAAMLGFLALPVAAVACAWRTREEASRRVSAALAALVAGGLVLFVASLWPTLGADRPPVLLGLSERVLLTAYVLWLWTMVDVQERAT
jgi:hypothetical protein